MIESMSFGSMTIVWTDVMSSGWSSLASCKYMIFFEVLQALRMSATNGTRMYFTVRIWLRMFCLYVNLSGDIGFRGTVSESFGYCAGRCLLQR